MLVPPQQDRTFYVYLSVGDTSIALVVIQVHDDKERVVFYLSRSVAEPPELFQLKCTNDRYTAGIILTHFKRNNPLVCRVSARYNHGSTGSMQVYLVRRRVYNHRTAHQLLIYRHSNLITNQV
jgi:hypothetical protein